jgi:hypothetical protein
MKVLIILMLLVSRGVQAKDNEHQQNGVGIYEMKRFNLSSGGGVIEAGAYKLTSSIGQVDASNDLISGDYKLQGGFFHQIRTTDLIFKNGFE